MFYLDEFVVYIISTHESKCQHQHAQRLPGQQSHQQQQLPAVRSQVNMQELAPRDDPFPMPPRDQPTRKATNPFRRVQVSRESSHSSQSIRSDPEPHPGVREEQGRESKVDAEFEAKVRKMAERINELTAQLESQKEEYESQSQANQIYSQGFAQLRETIIRMGVILEGESVQQLIEKTQRLLSTDQAGLAALLEQRERKIDELRLELVRSSENNINALFSTEITEAHCLQLQVKKMNTEIESLKGDLLRAVREKQQQINIRVQQSSVTQRQELVEMYEKLQVERDRQPNLNEMKLGQVVEGYRWLRDEYRGLENTINTLANSHKDVTQSISVIKKDITQSIQQQITQLQSSFKRPSSSQSQKNNVRELEIKLNHLINTLNAPEQANVEKQSDDDSYQKWRTVEQVRRMTELQSNNWRMQNEVERLENEKRRLESMLAHPQLATVRQGASYESQYQNNMATQREQQNRRHQERRLLSPLSEGREQHIVEQWSGEGGTNYVQSSSHYKQYGSHSYHESSSKITELQILYSKIHEYEHKLREKEIRINELENIILQHIQARTDLPGIHESGRVERLELYINNLKMLLHQARQENEQIKNQLIKWHQMGLDHPSFHEHDRSVTISDRTTKHGLGQTRLISKKPANVTYEASRVRLPAELEMETMCKALLQLIQSLKESGQAKRQSLKQKLVDCLKELILELRERESVVYQDVMMSQEIKLRLQAVGLELD